MKQAIHRIDDGPLLEPARTSTRSSRETLGVFRSGAEECSAAALERLNVIIELQRRATASLLEEMTSDPDARARYPW